MEKYIESKINTLPSKDKEEFDLISEEVSQDRVWLSLRSLSDASPETIRRVLYKEVFENDYSRLHGKSFQDLFLQKMQFPRN